MENDEIARYLIALEREDCYRVDATLKESPHELTQRVFFVGSNGSERGPYIRKLIHRESGLGAAYARIFASQQRGQRFKHIPTLHECYYHDDLLVVVMELIGGETLQERVYRLNPSAGLATDVFPILCDAVSELHESFDPPLIHRDLKPSNVMLPEGGLVIIDFGIAREFKQGAESDTARFGTRAFAPPEQFGFGQTTVRSDVYALGMLLYFCLTEKIPAPEVRDTGFAQRDVPMALRPVLARATSLDPATRYASARELKDSFIEAMGRLNDRRVGKRRGAIALASTAFLAIALATVAFSLPGVLGQSEVPAKTDGGSSRQADSLSSAISDGRQSNAPANREAEEAVLDDMATGAPIRNGFDPDTNWVITIAGVAFQLPGYFGASITQGEDDSTFYYAESGSSLAMVMAQASQLDFHEDDQSFDMKNVKDQVLIGFVESNEELFQEITSSVDCELAGFPARIVTLKGAVQGIAATTKAVFFFDVRNNTMGSLVFGQTDNVQFDCSADFAKTIASATPAG